MLPIKNKLVRCIYQDETCSNIGRNDSATDNCVVFFTTAVKLPCGLKQFEELAGGRPMLRIRRNGDHVRSPRTTLRPPSGWFPVAAVFDSFSCSERTLNNRAKALNIV